MQKFTHNAILFSRKFKNNMASESAEELNLDYENKTGDFKVKIICLGDSAVGKSK
jgi:hypothetical protein